MEEVYLKNKDLYKLCKKLNIIKYMNTLKNSNNIKENSSFSIGPPWYPGSKYGTISVKDFKLLEEDFL